MEWEDIKKGMDFASKELEAYSKEDQDKALVDIVRNNCFWIVCNNNDLWAWACADACQLSVDLDLDKAILAKLKFGEEGLVALMSIIKGIEQPQEPVFKTMNKDKFFEARAWILENMPPSDESD